MDRAVKVIQLTLDDWKVNSPDKHDMTIYSTDKHDMTIYPTDKHDNLTVIQQINMITQHLSNR
jgi:hypothetical protein